nr:receptor-like serine/threonine-protein kinase sd1-8 [Quercus suber]
MKCGWDLKKGINRLFTAWKKPDDPSPGDLTHGILEMGIHSYPEIYVWKGNKKFYRSGPWNGLRFSGSPDLKPNPVYDYYFVSNENEVYFTYTLKNKSLISRVVVNQTSHTRDRYIWIETEKVWKVYSSIPRDYCDSYGPCGANGNCILTASPVCQCLKAFKPKSPELWSLMEWSQGCVRNKPLSCHTDGFVKFVDLKLPDTTYSWVNKSMSLEECRVKCLKNCSCMAYTNSDISGGGSGCAIWFGDLMDIRQFLAGGQDLYIRMSASELLEEKHGPKIKIAVSVAVALAVVSGALLVGFYICRIRTNLKEYAFDGQFSTKSDVFSFGILLLEIISGKRSRGFFHPNHSHNLIGYAWILWNEGRPLELIDECLRQSSTLSEVLRCIHISLLCVQQRPEDRPSMSSVIVMLGSESALPQPKQPGFFLEKDSNEAHRFSSKQEPSSTNEITITLLEAR